MKHLALIALLALPLHADTRGGIVIDVNLGPLIARLTGRAIGSLASRHDCRISTVGYRFIGLPGAEFRYAGDSYQLPDEGQIELIATRRDSARSDEEVDQFGFAEREVAMSGVRR